MTNNPTPTLDEQIREIEKQFDGKLLKAELYFVNTDKEKVNIIPASCLQNADPLQEN